MPDDASSVAEILCRARAGDASALDTLFQRYRAYVHQLVRALCGGQLRTRLDSSDLVQETLVQAAQHFEQFEGTAEVEWRAWLRCIAQREVIHQLRHHLGAARRAVGREQRVELPASAAGRSSRLHQWCAASQSSPSQAAMRRERAVVLADALARLPDDYREVLVLHTMEGLAFPEVARRLNRSAGAVRVLWVRALKKLRATMTAAAGMGESSCHV